ncbi:hypothetical protein F966_01952 [Acinetobacter higginsii]|uniref:Sialidase domain-containing protein n=1 Tax=Acinetobacter higginsii TaxID=70347 RepID=N8WBJ7_9GAMM|nr:sialidase family protein [Acinetobacter higginsii]ENV09296.1 hypothetical protein F966_01952 [Acinetobacter higginsii]
MVTAVTPREYEIYGQDDNSNLCLYPRDVSHPLFAKLIQYRTAIISNIDYDAFPFVQKFKNSLIGIFSSGNSHANSDNQMIFRSDDNGLTFRMVKFFNNATLQYNTSLLDDLFQNGDFLNLKVWHIRKTNGAFDISFESSVIYNNTEYAIWSKPVANGSVLYRTGYGANAIGEMQTALFESSNNGKTWTFKSTIAAIGGKSFTEADIVNTTANNWLAIIRENTGQFNILYQVLSNDGGVTWGVPTELDFKKINGRQPNLLRLSDGSITLATGDRSGTSGYAGSAGNILNGTDTTGITIFRSINNGSTWSHRTRLSPMYSTDGGQPFVADLGGSNIFIAWYSRRTTKEKTMIVSSTLNVSNILAPTT